MADPSEKTFPAARYEDQEAIVEGKQERTVLGPPPFSSPDPATDRIKMMPLEDGTSAHVASLEAHEKRMAGIGAARGEEKGGYDKMSPAELRSLTEERDLDVKRSDGKDGNPLKADYIAALTADDASDMKASDFKERIAAATTQEELDEVANLYDESGKSYSTVESAIDAKQDEINEQSGKDEES